MAVDLSGMRELYRKGALKAAFIARAPMEQAGWVLLVDRDDGSKDYMAVARKERYKIYMSLEAVHADLARVGFEKAELLVAKQNRRTQKARLVPGVFGQSRTGLSTFDGRNLFSTHLVSRLWRALRLRASCKKRIIVGSPLNGGYMDMFHKNKAVWDPTKAVTRCSFPLPSFDTTLPPYCLTALGGVA